MFLFRKENKKEKILKELCSEYNIIDSNQELMRWIECENPYEFFTDEDKEIIRKIGTSLNNCIRSGRVMEDDKAFNSFKRLIKSKYLKNPLVVYRGQQSIEYETKLASEKELSNEYLLYNGFVYTSLSKTYYYNDNERMKIYIPKGTNYLYTGEYSNTPESNELVLDVGTVLKIIRRKKKDGIEYVEAMVENNLHY